MNIDASLIEELVMKAMQDMGNKKEINSGCSCGIFDTVDQAVDAAYAAQRQYMECSISDRERYIKAIRKVILKEETLNNLARLTVEETGMGNFEDKYLKNKLAAEKTPGTEDLVTEAIAGDDGLTLVELSPFGVIGSITPTTNPTETVISNSIGMLAAGNAVVFSPHPKSKGVTIYIIEMLNQALKDEGAPENLIVMVREPSVENTNLLMAHPKINMLVATGGPGIVKMALSTGKKTIGAGAGNPPVVVDETANIEKAAEDIVNGCSFDNNLPCIGEEAVIAVDSITDYLIFNMKKSGAYEIKDTEVLTKLTNLAVDADGRINRDVVGKSAKFILGQIGITVGDDIKVIIAETDKEHLLVKHELMMPILGIVRCADVDEAIDIAIEVEHGNRHTAIMHSTNVNKLTKMAKLIQTTIFVKNGPSYSGIGVGGEGYSTFTIAGPTGEGLTSAKSFARKRRCVLVDGFHIK